MTEPEPELPPADQARGVRRAQASAWNIANALTAIRLVLVPVFGWLLLSDAGQNRRWMATAVFVIAGLTDRLDGQLARQRGLVTEIGKLADPIADKALTGMALVGLSMLGELPWWVTAVVLAREVGITLLRFAVIRRGVIPASRGGKIKTALQAVAITMYLVPWGGLWHQAAVVVMAIAVVVTVVTGVDYLIAAWRAGRSGDLRRP